MQILITGGNGYIAKAIKSKYPYATSISRKDFDLTSSDQTKKWFKNKSYDIVIHTAVQGGSRLKQEHSDVLDNNLKMYYNLLQHKDKYKKFIHLGSGAEIYGGATWYGMSKKTIAFSMLDKTNFFNLKIFGLFDENELDTRFIKANLYRKLNNEPLIIHQNKAMDFIYMKDFLKIIDKYIKEDGLPQSIDCVYKDKYSLIDIANLINNLTNDKVDIHLYKQLPDGPYTGEFTDIGINYIELTNGIIETYNIIKEKLNEKNMVCSK